MKKKAVFTQQPVFTLNFAGVTELKKTAEDPAVWTNRICLHPSPEARLHEMVIVHEKDVYVRPHKHIGKSESFHIIEGELDVFIFDDAGKVVQKIEMGEYRSGKAFCYRLSAASYHTVLPRSPIAVFHEVTDGPFKREETVFADWAPEDTDLAGAREFVEKLKTH